MIRRGLFTLLLVTAVVLGLRLSSLYPQAWDLTAAGRHSLDANATAALAALPAAVRITAFVGELPVLRAQVEQLLAPYRRSHLDLRWTFVDPAAQPELARALGIRRQGELLIESDGRRQQVRISDAAHLTRALARLARNGTPWILFLAGSGGRAPHDAAADGLQRLTDLLAEQGYRSLALDPLQDMAIPDNTALLVLPGPTQAYPPTTQAHIDAYLARGGNLLWLAEHPVADTMGTPFGIGFLPGRIVDAAAADVGIEHPGVAIVGSYPDDLPGLQSQGYSQLPTCRALTLDAAPAWRLRARLQSSARSWNETGALRGRIARDPAAGEHAGPLDVLALFESTIHPGQRVAIVGDTDFASNGEIGRGHNIELALGLVHWLTDNSDLPAGPAATDLRFTWSPSLAAAIAALFGLLLPLGWILIGLAIRRRRLRA